jgi:hypothetical protein
MLIFAFQMEIVEIIEGSLYAIKWQDDNMHSLDEMADKLSDAEWLYDYFEENKSKLSYYRDVTIGKAVRKTIIEANELLQEIWDLANTDHEENEALDDLFEHLHKEEAYNHSRYHTDFKAKGYKAPWVRIYAVRCDDNLYAITGYAIKLVRKMQDDEDLRNELKKLESATYSLKEIGML